MIKKLIRKMQTAAGGPLRLKFTPEQISYFESRGLPLGMNNSKNYREEGVLALLYQELEKVRKELEITSRMEMKPVLVKKASKLGEKNLYKLQVNTAAGVVSPVDPVAEFFMYGNPALKGVGALAKTGLWNVAKYAPTTLLGNWGRGYFVGNTFKNSFNGVVPALSSQATSLLYQPVKLNETGLTSLKFFERKPAKSVTKEYVQSPKDITSDVGDLIAEGSERSVYASKSNPNIVYKIEDGNAPLEDINNIKIRPEINDDIIAPETTIGYYKHKNGKYYRVTQQDKYKSYDPDNFFEEESPELNLEIIDVLLKAGWKVNIKDGHATTASKNGVTIGNLEHFNWGRDSKGNLKLIDLYVAEKNPSTIQISPEELYKVLKNQELNGYYFMGHGTGRSNVNPLVIFDNGLRIKNGDIGNTTVPISLSNLSLWPHANSKEVIILPGKAENVKFDAARGRIPSDWYDSKTFQWDDNPGFEGSGFFAALKPNATFVETEINGVPGVYTKPEAILGSYNIDTQTLKLNPRSLYNFFKKQGGKMNILEFLKNGSGIHIKKKNRGSFTRWCGGNVTEECIRRGKASSNPKIRKKATFADNARHFKHKSGGKAFVNGVSVLDSNPDAYKHVKKKVKMRLYGGPLEYLFKEAQYLKWVNDYLNPTVINHNPDIDANRNFKFNNSILQLTDEYNNLKLLEAERINNEAQRYSSFLSKGLELLFGYLNKPKTTNSTYSNSTYSNTTLEPKLVYSNGNQFEGGMLNTDSKTFFNL